MIEQIEFGTRDEHLLAEEASERGMVGVVKDLNDELAVICAHASLGGDISYDAERTESYFAVIESAGQKAAQITRQLLVLDPARPPADRPSKAVPQSAGEGETDAPIDPQPTASSFRSRLTSARTLLTKTGSPRRPL